MTIVTLAPYFVLLAGALLTGLVTYVLIRAHYDKKSPINLAFLLLDGTLDPPRVTLAKASGLIALVVSSWVVILLSVEGKMDANILGVYVIGWGATKVAGDFTSLRERSMTKVDNPDA